MIRASDERELRRDGARARVSREALLASLGSHCSSWYIDSSESDLQLHLAWECGCRAQKRGFVDRLWAYEPCRMHAASGALTATTA